MTCAHDWVIAQPCPYCRIADLEADNAALRKLLLRWLQIINRAKKDAATVAEWDKLRQETDAAMLAGNKT